MLEGSLWRWCLLVVGGDVFWGWSMSLLMLIIIGVGGIGMCYVDVILVFGCGSWCDRYVGSGIDFMF